MLAMNICLKCKVELQCVKTGVVAVFSGDHCYAGDAFECPNCKAQTLVTAGTPHHDPYALNMGGINMDNWPNEPKKMPEKLRAFCG